MILFCKRVRLEAFLFIRTGLQILEGPWRTPGGDFEAENELGMLWKASGKLWGTWKALESNFQKKLLVIETL